MHAYLGGVCNAMESQVLIVGGVADHVHILCALSRNYSMAKLIEEIKRNSSKWIKSKGGKLSKFAWQNGYGVFSVSHSQAEYVKRYIAGQKEHHKKKPFKNEFRECLVQHQLEYSERYVWD